MPEFPRLQFTGSYGFDCEVAFAIIRQELGDGYGNRLLTGSSAGIPGWRLAMNVLPGTPDGGIEVAGDIISREKYIWDFYIARGAEASGSFILTDPRSGRDYLVGFAENKLSYKNFGIKLYSTGLPLEYRREPGVPTLEDGSLGLMENPDSI
jgi:hypothetical protein